MAHVEVDQSGEKVIPTGGLGLSRSMTSSVELITDKSKPLIEIAEPSPHARYDSESDNEECAWLANPGKIAPKRPAYEPEPQEAIPEREPTPPPPPEPEPVEHPEHEERAEYAELVSDPIQAASNFLQSSNIFSDTEDGIRRKKSSLLHQYSLKNKDKRYSSKILTMDSDLREIQDELQFVDTRKSMEGSLSLWKTGLVILSDGLVRMNERFDPFGVDMGEWSQRMWYDVMQKGSYDEVLLELVDKYKGSVPIGPELRLLTMLGMSFGGTLLTKKQEQAQLEKLRKEQERHINAEVEARVRERMASQAAPRMPAGKPSGRSVPRARPPPPPRSPSPELQGPTFTADEIRNLMKNDLVSSSDEASEPKTPPRSVVSSPASSRAVSPARPPPVSRSPSPIVQPAPAFETTPAKRRGVRAPARGARRGRGRGGDLIIALDKD